MKTTQKDGTPILCRFCHKPVWVDDGKGRMLETDGTTFHVTVCPLRHAFYKEQGYANAETRRLKKHAM
jgi:hypothetical protein